MKTRTLVIIAIIVFIVLIASYWNATEQYTGICTGTDTDAGADSMLNLYKTTPTSQINGNGFRTCDGVVYVPNSDCST